MSAALELEIVVAKVNAKDSVKLRIILTEMEYL